MYCSCILSTWYKLLLSMVVYWMTWYCYYFLLGFKCIFQLYSNFRIYNNLDIDSMYHCALISCTQSQSIGLVFGCALLWYWVSWCIPFTNSSIEFYLITIIVPIIEIWGPFFFIVVVLVLQKRTSLSILDWTCYLYVRFRFSAGVFYRGVPGFATDRPYGVWRCGLTTGLPYIGPIFRNLV